jgi:hypothetical protein
MAASPAEDSPPPRAIVDPDQTGPAHRLSHFRLQRSTPMTNPQFYYLLFVILSFTGFGLAIAAGYIRYRRWLATQPPRHL